MCCQDDNSEGLPGACESGLFRLGSGDELQTSVCCFGRRSCRRAEFTGSPLSVLNCDGRSSCREASALVAGDLSCNGRSACIQSKMNFSLGNEYPGFVFLVIFHLYSLKIILGLFVFQAAPGRQIPGMQSPAVVNLLALSRSFYSCLILAHVESESWGNFRV